MRTPHLASRALISGCVLLALGSVPSAHAELVTVEQAAMGGAVVMQVDAAPERAMHVAMAIHAAYDEIERLEAMLSSWRPTSEVSRINAAAGGAPVEVSSETFALVQKSIEIGEITDGAFDITFGPLGAIWNFGGDSSRLPDRQAIDAARHLVDFRRIEIDELAHTVRLPLDGMRIGLAGIAKGYIVDRACDVLRTHGFTNFSVNAAGDMRAEGLTEGRPWTVGILDPRDPQAIIAMLPVTDASIVTSGDYERFFELGGRRYHHIIDPATGLPATGVRSVTVLSIDSGIADALATGIFVLGPVEGLGLAERLEGVEALLVDEHGEILTTSGLVEEIKPLAD